MVIRLRELRKKSGLTMKELGNLVGVAESTISQYETGKRQPDFDTFLRIREYFGVSADYLLGNDHDDDYSAKFRENLSYELGIVRTYLAGDEPEMGDYYALEELANSKRSLSLAEVCEAADVLGSTVGHLLGEDEYDSTENEQETKKSLDPAEAGPRDNMEQEFIGLVRKLQPAQKPFLLALLRTAVEQTQGKPGAEQVSDSETVPIIEHQGYSN